MTRRIFAGATVALLVLSGALYAGGQFTLTDKNTTITFLGTKKDGKHNGGFKGISGTASVEGADPTTLKVNVELDMKSLYADNPKLTNHLKSPDFFGVKTNPKSKFVSTKIEKSGDDYKVTGTLTMIGKSKEITFPAKVAVGADGLTVASTFTIDRTQWGMTFGKGKIDNDVKLTINVKAK